MYGEEEVEDEMDDSKSILFSACASVGYEEVKALSKSTLSDKNKKRGR